LLNLCFDYKWMIFNIYTLIRIMLILTDIQYVLSKREYIHDVVVLTGLKITKFCEKLVYITIFYIIL